MLQVDPGGVDAECGMGIVLSTLALGGGLRGTRL